MRTLGIIAACIAVLIGGAIAWWKISYPTYTYRYRMTVEVLVDGAVRSGSSVIEIRVHKQPKFGSAPPQVSKVYGEAVFIDLGDGRNLIALLASGPAAKDVNYSYNVVPAAFGLTFNDQDLAKLSSLRGIRPVSRWPTFVTFTDLNDPKTARVVTDDFEQVFGPGVQPRSVVVEPTDAPITWRIEEKMPGAIRRLREEARKSQFEMPSGPYIPYLGHFIAGG